MSGIVAEVGAHVKIDLIQFKVGKGDVAATPAFITIEVF